MATVARAQPLDAVEGPGVYVFRYVVHRWVRNFPIADDCSGSERFQHRNVSLRFYGCVFFSFFRFFSDADVRLLHISRPLAPRSDHPKRNARFNFVLFKKCKFPSSTHEAI